MTTAIGPQGPNFTTVRPSHDAKASATDTWFKNCSIPGAKDGTYATADFFNVIIANIREAIRGAGILLDDLDDFMLLKAMQFGIPYGVAAGAPNALSVDLDTHPTDWTHLRLFLVKITAGNTASATITPTGLPTRNLKQNDGTTNLASGDLRPNGIAVCLNDGTNVQVLAMLGGDDLITEGTTLEPPGGARLKLRVSNAGGSPNTQIALTADELVLGSVAGYTRKVRNVNLVLSSGIAGAGGIDTGAVANSTAYDIYVGFNPTTNVISGWLTVEGNAPTLPAGYTFYKRFSWTRTDASARFYRITQVDDEWRYIAQGAAGVNTKAPPVFATGEQGISGTTPIGWVAVNLAGLIPTKSLRVELIGNPTSTSYTTLAYAPNTNYAKPGDAISADSTQYFSGVNQYGTTWTLAQHVSLWLEGGTTIYVMQQANVMSFVLGGKLII